MRVANLIAVCLVLTSVPALAQTAAVQAQAPPGASAKAQGKAAATPAAKSPTKAAAKAPERVPTAAGPATRTPVVQPSRNVHAVKPPAGAAVPAKSPAPTAPPPAAPAEAAVPPGPPKGSVTGLPLPRWASLRTDEVNLRKGPGTRYGIDWVYKRRDLPVQIEREFEVWRQIEDQDGVKGWVHQATLIGRRSFVVTGAERVLRGSARDDASAVARLKPGVVGRIRSCDAGSEWCEVQVGDYRGWLKRAEFWGTYAGEAVQ